MAEGKDMELTNKVINLLIRLKEDQDGVKYEVKIHHSNEEVKKVEAQ